MGQNICLPKLKDRSLIECIGHLGGKFSHLSPRASIGLLGPISHSFNPASCADDKLITSVIEKDSYLVFTATFSVAGYSFYFYRGGNQTPKSPFTDEIVINDNNQTQLSDTDKLEIACTLIKKLKAFAPDRSIGTKQSKEQAELAAIHESTLDRLESLGESLIKETHKYRLETDLQLNERLESLEEQYSEKENKLKRNQEKLIEEVKKREEQLEQRQKELDDKSNTHARRQIRRDIIQEIKRRQSDFTLTTGTQKLRNPIAAAMFLLIAIFSATLIYSSRSFYLAMLSGDAYQIAITAAKQLVYSAGAIGTAIFYIRWQNRWFEQHAQAEFHLKQLELDMERASWIVETSLEWKDAKGTTIPPELLGSLSHNLFREPQEKIESAIHPADQLASALFGSASTVKLRSGDSEVQIDANKLRKSDG